MVAAHRMRAAPCNIECTDFGGVAYRGFWRLGWEGGALLGDGRELRCGVAMGKLLRGRRGALVARLELLLQQQLV